MNALKLFYSKINLNIINLTNKRFFNEIYVFILACFTIIGWKYNQDIGMILLIISGLISLILTNNLKFVIPNVIFFIFTFSKGFANSEFPIHIIILGGIFAVIVLIFSFKNGIKIKKMHSLIGLLGLAITNIIPLIYANNIPEGNEVFYFFYFGNLGYLLLYIIMVNGIKGEATNLLAVSMSYLALILTAQCGFTVYEKKDTVNSIFQLWYYLGWGLCNEAGIMLCMCFPFIFYLIGKQEKATGMIFHHTKLLIGIVGLLLTTSRGSYIFGLLEIATLYLVLLFCSKKPRLYQNLFFIFWIVVLVSSMFFRQEIINFITEVVENVFNMKLDDSGRKELWIDAYKAWDSNWITRVFGAGITCSIREQISGNGIQLVPVVFHSTILETLVCGGIIGFTFLIINFGQKYFYLLKGDKLLFVTLGIGYLFVDLYGMIDNTYHMYYFMLPLMVIMAVVDLNIKPKNSKKN